MSLSCSRPPCEAFTPPKGGGAPPSLRIPGLASSRSQTIVRVNGVNFLLALIPAAAVFPEVTEMVATRLILKNFSVLA